MSLANPLGAKLAFELPGLAVRPEGFAEPMKRVGRYLGEGPARRRAIGANTNLHNILSAPTANLFCVMITGRIPPRDAPRLNRRIPHSQRGAVHVHLFVQ